MEQLLNEVQTITESYTRVARATGENFNIFSIMHMETDEVSTHSRLIAELLNPNGTHGQKDIFLKKFIKGFCIENFKTQDSKVHVEYHVAAISEKLDSGGRIDILIKNPDGNVIMIENKIYAIEQPNQLLRYNNAFPEGELFYLTLFGERSKEKTSERINYKEISYEHDIVNWLEECKKEAVDIPILRETISQYINLVKKLTNQSVNENMELEIINRILRDKNSIESYKNLYSVHEKLKSKLISEIVKKIKQKLELEGFKNIKTMDITNSKGLFICFQNETLEKHNLHIRLNFEGSNYSDLIIGFFDETQNWHNREQLFEVFKKEYSNGKQSALYPSYLFYEGCRNWDFDVLSKVYFEFEIFFHDLKNKLDLMLSLFNQINKS